MIINWPLGLQSAKYWSALDPKDAAWDCLALLLDAMLELNPSNRLAVVHRRHCTCLLLLFDLPLTLFFVVLHSQPALISYTPTHGRIVLEDTVPYDEDCDQPTDLPVFDAFGPCDCNLETCLPPDLSRFCHSRPVWKPRQREDSGNDVHGGKTSSRRIIKKKSDV